MSVASSIAYKSRRRFVPTAALDFRQRVAPLKRPTISGRL